MPELTENDQNTDTPKKDPYVEVRKKVIAVLETIYDPEIPLNIYRLGLIYTIDLFQDKAGRLNCNIEMTLTSPGCPVAENLIEQVYNIAKIVDEIEQMNVDIVFDPPWSPEKMSYEARLELGLL